MSFSVANTNFSNTSIEGPLTVDDENKAPGTSLIGFVATLIKTTINLVGMIPLIGTAVGVARIAFALIAGFVWYVKGATLDQFLYTKVTRVEIQANWRTWRNNQCWRGIIECIPISGGLLLLIYDLFEAGTPNNPSFY